MKFYFTEENFPVQSNSPQAIWKEVTKEDYDIKVKELNDKDEEDKAILETSMKNIEDQDKRIQDKLREMALKELKEEDLR